MTTDGQISYRSRLFNRILYGTFVLLSIYFLLVRSDLASAMSNLGLALVFDPFDQRVRWNSRPMFQRAWLFTHVALVFALLGLIVRNTI